MRGDRKDGRVMTALGVSAVTAVAGTFAYVVSTDTASSYPDDPAEPAFVIFMFFVLYVVICSTVLLFLFLIRLRAKIFPQKDFNSRRVFWFSESIWAGLVSLFSAGFWTLAHVYVTGITTNLSQASLDVFLYLLVTLFSAVLASLYIAGSRPADF